MAVYPLQFFTQSNVPIGFNARYKTSPLGIKYAGQPKGVYVGFIPTTLGSVLTLSPDPTFGYSLIKIPSQGDPSGMDIILDTPITLDFVGQPSMDFPLLVVAQTTYFDDAAQPTTAMLTTRSGPSSSITDDEVLVCIVDGPDVSITVANNPTLNEQNVPIAYAGVNFGYMLDGSIESLQAAADIVNEVVAARIGLDSTNHASLSARIAEDYSATSMAARLAVVSRILRSNDYVVSAGDTETIVSGSFTEIDRDFLPSITLEGTGNETTEGALASPNDSIRNVGLLVDATTGYRIVDDPTTRDIIFVRLDGPGEETVSGEWRFLNASQNVAATDGNGQATTEIQPGDTILGPDGKYYEVEGVIDNNNLEISTAFQAASATTGVTSIRRWTIQYKKLVAGVEQTATLPSDTTVRFFFPAFVLMANSAADWKLAMHTAAERTPLVGATTTVPGLVRLANTGSLLGSVAIQNAGVALGGGPFHTINFNAPSASVLPSPTIPGEVQIAQIGEQGSQGAPGPAGGPGNPGGTGPGFSQLNPFEISPEITFPGVNPPMPFTFTQDMGHNVRVVHGNIARFRDFGIFAGGGLDRIEIGGVTIASATEGRIEGTIAGDNALHVFLSSAGD